MNDINELIDKFWTKEINPAEQRKLFELISKAPAELKMALQKDFEKDLSAQKEECTEKRFQDLLEKLHARIEEKELKPVVKTFPLYNWLKLVAALLVVTIGLVFYSNWQQTSPKQSVTVKSAKTEILRQPYNSGKTAMKINLTDGSVVTLQPGSSLSYYEPFNSQTRSISMIGEATFKVAKDKHHPFIVTAKGFTTTALGTAFTINTTKNNQITVNLREGKVVVKSTAKSGLNLKDVYLIPGQQLAIDIRRKAQVVTNFNQEKKPVELKPITKMPLPEPLIFEEAPLDHVFDRLSKRYKVRISYEGMESSELQKRYFTGTFGGSEKLEVLLPSICNMNELTYKRTANSIVISKQK
ncbi:DUF4974 domain-containing protein [Pedobacter petrophilus]|uniref:DUF4974 domain-containing protein n=1 Tax=Pedobacter petrophilus TaxID=1908241 RepID=A0A7K0FXZ8_9SPHI|nr:FecR family protein [Pedobacter petrophilus]MRX76468.1 DUF4974 domain-containing protein [Pedobacter petrophilus]